MHMRTPSPAAVHTNSRFSTLFIEDSPVGRAELPVSAVRRLSGGGGVGVGSQQRDWTSHDLDRASVPSFAPGSPLFDPPRSARHRRHGSNVSLDFSAAALFSAEAHASGSGGGGSGGGGGGGVGGGGGGSGAVINGLCKSTAFCELYVLSDEDLGAVLARWPAERKAFLAGAREIQRHSYVANQSLLQHLDLFAGAAGAGGGGGGGGDAGPASAHRPSMNRARSTSLSDTDFSRHLFQRHNSFSIGMDTGDMSHNQHQHQHHQQPQPQLQPQPPLSARGLTSTHPHPYAHHPLVLPPHQSTSSSQPLHGHFAPPPPHHPPSPSPATPVTPGAGKLKAATPARHVQYGSNLVYDMIRSAQEEQQRVDQQREVQKLQNADSSKRDMLQSARRVHWWQVIIAPASTFRLVWSLLSLCGLLYLAISVPVSVLFAVDPFLHDSVTAAESWAVLPWFLVLNVLVDCFFAADIFLHANHFAFVNHGMVIRKLRSIRKHYMRDKSDVAYYVVTPLKALRLLIEEQCMGGARAHGGGSGRKRSGGGGGGSHGRGSRRSAAAAASAGSRRRTAPHGGLFNGLLLDVLISLPFELLALVPAIGLEWGGVLRVNRLVRVMYLSYYFRFIEMYLQNVEREQDHSEQNNAQSTVVAAAAPAAATAVAAPTALGSGAVVATPAPSPSSSFLSTAASSCHRLLRALRSLLFSFALNPKFLDVFRILLVLALALWLLGCFWSLLACVPSVRGVSWLERDHLHVSDSVLHTVIRAMWLVLLSRTSDSEAVSDLEMCGSMLIMLVGTFLVPTIVGLLEHLVENLDAVESAFEEKRTIVRSYMSLKSAPPTLQTRVLAYYGQLSLCTFLHRLPPPLAFASTRC